VRVIVVADEESGDDKLGFEYLEGPVTPKPEKIPQPHAKPKRRSGPPRRKPMGPKGGGDDKPSHRGSVPKVPLVKV
jgi:ATP-dependent Clp protease ATP-binding subunit ClpA